MFADRRAGGETCSSGGSRTAIVTATGRRTQLYSVTAAVAVLGVVVLLRPLLASFPLAALCIYGSAHRASAIRA